jgi:hypothetical protein
MTNIDETKEKGLRQTRRIKIELRNVIGVAM